MAETIAERYRRWGVDELLNAYPDLRIVPTRGEDLQVGGELRFRVRGPAGDELEDSYSIAILIPPEFPSRYARARETGGRIPKGYHKLDDGSLCLAARTELRLKLGPSSTMGDFVELFVIPYLYGFSLYERDGVVPYGELEHGNEGLRQHFASLFGVGDRAAAQEFVRLTSLKRRDANKERCPCGKNRRLGRCHNRIVNNLRDNLGRRWFASEYKALCKTKITWGQNPMESAPQARRRRGRLSS